MGRCSMRLKLLLVTLISCSFQVQVTAAPFEIDFTETDDLLLIYQDPFQTYLVPHVSKSFHNSLAFQRYLFDWVPNEKTTLVLTDFSDYGNAGVGESRERPPPGEGDLHEQGPEAPAQGGEHKYKECNLLPRIHRSKFFVLVDRRGLFAAFRVVGDAEDHLGEE